MALLCFFLMALDSGEKVITAKDRQIGQVLGLYARLGMSPEEIEQIFGRADSSMRGRIDWRENPDPYVLLQYSRYGVWVEWQSSPMPRTGTGMRMRVYGGLGNESGF